MFELSFFWMSNQHNTESTPSVQPQLDVAVYQNVINRMIELEKLKDTWTAEKLLLLKEIEELKSTISELAISKARAEERAVVLAEFHQNSVSPSKSKK